MANYGDKEICRVLKVVQDSDTHSFFWKSVDYTRCNEPTDAPDVSYAVFGHDDELPIRAAIEKGFFTHDASPDHEYPREVGHRLRLTAIGNEFLNEFGAPIYQRWWRNVASNLPTFLGSVITALVIAWLSRFI